MISKALPLAAAAVAAASGLAGILHVLDSGIPSGVLPRLGDPAEKSSAAAIERTDLEGRFEALGGAPSSLPGSWPRFRGAAFDNRAPGPGLAETWPAAGPPVLWSAQLGEGHAGPAVSEGRVYLLDYDEQEQADCLRCLSLDDGRDLWKRSYSVRLKRNHGMSRTVPAVGEGFVLTFGPRCHVLCCDALSGAFAWGLDLEADFGVETPLWYAGQCPLIDSGEAVIAVGAKDLAIGVDLPSGEIKWRTPDPGGFRMSHSSILPMTLAGRRTFVYCAVGGVAGISAEPGDRGRLLWKTAGWSHAVTAPSPVALDGGRFLVTAGYGAGSAVIRVVEEGGEARAAVEAVFDKTVFACEQHTPVFHEGRLYTVMPADGGALKRQLLCADGDFKTLWTSGPENRYGLGPFMVAGDRLLVLRDDGWLFMAGAGGERFEEKARARVLSGRDAWAPMALAGTRLLLRDWKTLLCLELGAD